MILCSTLALILQNITMKLLLSIPTVLCYAKVFPFPILKKAVKNSSLYLSASLLTRTTVSSVWKLSAIIGFRYILIFLNWDLIWRLSIPFSLTLLEKFISVKQRTTPKIRLLSLKLCVSVSFRHLHYLMKISWLFASFQDTDFVWLTTVPIWNARLFVY